MSMKVRHRTRVTLALLGAGGGLAHADLVGVNYSTGGVFSISTDNAAATQIGQTATGIMGLDRDAGGSLLAITDGLAGTLGVLDEQSWQLGTIGRLGAGFTFEGGLAVNAGGEIYGGSRLSGGGRAIFRIDHFSGQMGQNVLLSRASIDLNGLQFRGDGALVAIDALAGDLVSIDVSTGQVSSIAPLLTPAAGAVGGLAIDNGVGYYVTSGMVSGADGDNSLYSIDLYTGEQRLIGSLGAEAGAGFGIGALAGPSVPTPAGMLLLSGAGLLSAARRRRDPSGVSTRRAGRGAASSRSTR